MTFTLDCLELNISSFGEKYDFYELKTLFAFYARNEYNIAKRW
jgi:hypothetical protein